MKTIFFSGKGGVGKSTLASAVAWQLMDAGNRVLAVSFDPAHNLGDIFHTKLSHRKKRFKKTDLFLQETDLEQSANEYIEANMSLLNEVYSYMQPFNMDSYFNVLKYSPGVEEYAAITAMEKLFREERENYDYIVIDTPPTGLTLRILALPKITVAWIDRLVKLRKQILEKRYTIHKLSGKYSEKGTKLAYEESEDTVMRKLLDMRERYRNVQNWLESEKNSICVVFNPDYLSLRESQRLMTGVKDLNLPMHTVYHNKLDNPNSDIAQKVEHDLLKGRSDVIIERVPNMAEPEPTCYIMDKNLIQSFQENT
ncbi:MAG: ArsA family ATPase [Spirochaetaceae bacterium]|nr:ArsA family ATPase [Spirochaetaceae bacterium]